MTRLKMSVRVRAEGLGITLKSITTFLILLYDSKSNQGDLALVAFAIGQLHYGLAMMVAYMYYLGPTVMFPRIVTTSKYVARLIDSPC
jgi:oligosaccharide translocation protein RFT1